MKNKPDILTVAKYVAYGAVGFYLYQVVKNNGGRLSGNPEGWEVKIDKDKLVDKVMPWIDVNPQYRDALSHAMKTILTPKGTYR